MKVIDIKINPNLSQFPYLTEFVKRFDLDLNTTLFAYKDTIFTKLDPRKIPYAIKAHELVHMHQQERDGLEQWFDNYLNDKKKRFEYEIEAYKEEKNIFPSGQWKKRLAEITPHLTGKMYGECCTREELYNILK